MFADYVDWRAEHPSDDIMTELLNAEFEDETGTRRNASPRQELLTYIEVVAGAGNETSNAPHRLGRQGPGGSSRPATPSWSRTRP